MISNVKWEKSDSISTSSPSDAAASSFLQSLSVACPNKLIIAATYYNLNSERKGGKTEKAQNRRISVLCGSWSKTRLNSLVPQVNTIPNFSLTGDKLTRTWKEMWTTWNIERKKKENYFTFWCNAGTMARRLTRHISPSAGIRPLPMTNSRISAKIPCKEQMESLFGNNKQMQAYDSKLRIKKESKN